MGALGGMAADLDVLIRSSSDPLLAILYHRHFTHSLAFIPIGGLIASLPWLLFRRMRLSWRVVLSATTLGYATHALLDACTTYGTQLLWPFTSARVSWHVVSVIDPLFTLPLLAAVLLAVRKRSTSLMHIGNAWAVAYLLLGLFQRERAASAQHSIARERGHLIARADVFPSFGNNVTWRAVYESGSLYHIDKIRVPWFGPVCVSPGTSVALAAETHLDDPNEARAHQLLRWFSDGWVASDPEDPSVLGDLRYSFAPDEVTPIWGIRTRAAGHIGPYVTEWVNNRSRRAIHFSDFYRLVCSDSAVARCY
jgi:inner membrane protein